MHFLWIKPKMNSIKNIGTSLRASFRWLRNFVVHSPGTTIVVLSCIGLCLIVPNVNVDSGTMYVPVKLVNTERFSEQNRSSVSVDKKVAQIKMDRLINDIVIRNTEVSMGNRYLTERGQRKYELLGRQDMLMTHRTCKRRLPEAIIIGVMKAGTEAFSTFLAINPQIAMSLNIRSTLFFTSKYHNGLDWYRHQMACSTENQITVEKAPQYYANIKAPGRIHKMNRHIKLILLVRNPIDRAVSHYLQVKNSHPKDIKGRSFENMVLTRSGSVNAGNKFIYFSKYSTILKRWRRYFYPSQILILDGDEFKDNQISVLSKAESFLGVEHFITKDKFVFDKEKGFYCLKGKHSPVCLGSGKGREHPELRPATYHKLRSYFKPYNEELFRIIGKRFNW